MAFSFDTVKEEHLREKYELIKEQRIEDLNSDGILLRHIKSGARLVLLSNSDENKVFCIGFRTPPNNDTGTQHIIEHTVLCGSRKYPVKDPFVELCKGSLNTFLNAMTYPDKTLYPVASCNLVDFKNITDVYLDAVFFPAIYNKEEIFMQEGWHYELKAADEPLRYNGVVYNEMKGAYSSPDELLSRYTMQALFPDTAYSMESGGDPEKITDLTREEYLEYHKHYYHPANSYIYLYGDMDMEERLSYLDREYLSHFDKKEAADIVEMSSIRRQQPFEEKVMVERDYAITADEPQEDNSYLAYNVVMSTVLDRKMYLAMKVLDYVLVTSSGAVLKQALLEKGVGADVYSSYECSMLQPVYSIIAGGCEPSEKQVFLNIIHTVVSDLANNGIDRDTLLAGINFYEFRYREADFGSYPKGLIYGMQMMDSWLYDEREPFMHIDCGTTFRELKEGVENEDGYFEDVLKNVILDNMHACVLLLNPKRGLAEENDAKTVKKLEQIKANLSKKEINAIIKKTEALKAYQEKPDSQEALSHIPMLSLADIRKEAAPLYNEEADVNGTTIVRHTIFTNNIGYMTLSFDCRNVADEDMPYLGLLMNVVGMMDTEQYTLSELTTSINLNTGGIYTAVPIYIDKQDTEQFYIRFEIKAKALYDKLDKALELIHKMLFTTKYNDAKRLKEIIEMNKSRMEQSSLNSGHSVAMQCATAQFSKSTLYSGCIKGYEYYRAICDMQKNFDTQKEAIAKKLYSLAEAIFRKDNLIVSFTAQEEGFAALEEPLSRFVDMLPKEMLPVQERKLSAQKESLGLTSSSQVQYVARCGNFRMGGFGYTGALKVLKVIFSYDYLWSEVRVKGGAYGCMSGFSFDGDSYLVSYRDPNLVKTNQIYEAAADYVRNFTVSERDMLKFIIGTIGDMDTPLMPSMVGSRSFAAYLTHLPYEKFQQERDEVLSANQESIRKLADLLEFVVNQNYFCVVGSEGQIRECADLFDTIQPLIQ